MTQKNFYSLVGLSMYISSAVAGTTQPQLDVSKLIDELYKNISGFTISEDERTGVRTQGGDPTYGEITVKGAAELLKDLDLQRKDVFYDLGSGVGKLVVQTALTTPVGKAVGVELAPTRHEHAQAIKNEIEKRNLLKDTKLEFQRKNVAEIPLEDASVIFMCSTCFSDELMKTLMEKMGKLKKGLRVLTLKRFPESTKFTLVKTYQIPMTWSNSTNVYLYKLN
ncbi:MAG: Histone methylation protein DOT1 [Candidatus Dependentiae bacterium ADurb.Bin331]|nr:MAG: Histone methylation protein DOT1 [Candidatus Dependentiae bacterium ADurb.Bin331]